MHKITEDQRLKYKSSAMECIEENVHKNPHEFEKTIVFT
jgi:hypothetical protein